MYLSLLQMVPLEFERDAVTQSKVLKELSAMISSEVLDKHMGEHGSLCFVVRRPG
jgi:hypothetical protein